MPEVRNPEVRNPEVRNLYWREERHRANDERVEKQEERQGDRRVFTSSVKRSDCETDELRDESDSRAGMLTEIQILRLKKNEIHPLQYYIK